MPEVDSNFIDALNQFEKEFSAIMDGTDLAKHTKKMQDFINLGNKREFDCKSWEELELGN